MGDKVTMYRPFVADIAKMEKTDDRTVRFTLKQPNAAFVTASLAKIPDGASKDEGRAFGSKVAEMFVAERSKDRMDAKAEHKPGSGPGQWRPTPPANLPMVAPQAAD